MNLLLSDRCSRIFIYKFGGSGRIRTHGTFRYDGLVNRCLKPLSHTSFSFKIGCGTWIWTKDGNGLWDHAGDRTLPAILIVWLHVPTRLRPSCYAVHILFHLDGICPRLCDFSSRLWRSLAADPMRRALVVWQLPTLFNARSIKRDSYPLKNLIGSAINASINPTPIIPITKSTITKSIENANLVPHLNTLLSITVYPFPIFFYCHSVLLFKLVRVEGFEPSSQRGDRF